MSLSIVPLNILVIQICSTALVRWIVRDLSVHLLRLFWSILIPANGIFSSFWPRHIEIEGITNWVEFTTLVLGLRAEVVEVDAVELGLHALLVYFHLLLLNLHLNLLEPLMDFWGSLFAVFSFVAGTILKFWRFSWLLKFRGLLFQNGGGVFFSNEWWASVEDVRIAHGSLVVCLERWGAQVGILGIQEGALLVDKAKVLFWARSLLL